MTDRLETRVRVRAWRFWLLAALCALGAAGLALTHPVAPAALALGLLLAAAAVAWRPLAWLFLLPALLPVMSFAPWTGWWLVDESDALVLACLAGGYARWALDGRAGFSSDTAFRVLWGALALSLAWGVGLGLGDAVSGAADRAVDWQAGLYAGYDSAWNTLRVAKGLLWALLLGGLLRAPGAGSAADSARAVARGMVAGLSLVCTVVLWERLAYAGLFDFSLPYRTTAWFWEMHVGGGAIDAYLALAVPFAFWAVWTAPTLPRWMAAQGLMGVSVYAVLTTYSRGVYLAVLIALAFMAVTACRYRIRPALSRVSGRGTVAVLFAVLVAQSALVLGGGSFMAARLASSEVDMVGRLTHWRSGLDLLHTPKDWALGLGLGRLPAHYHREVEAGGFPGQVGWQRDPQGRPHAVLAGPARAGQRAGLFALTQRVGIEDLEEVRVRVQAAPVRPGRLGTGLLASLCEQHLLHEFRCLRQWVPLDGRFGAEARDGVEVVLDGEPWHDEPGPGWLRQWVFALTPYQAGAPIRIDRVELFDAGGRQWLRNTGFAQGLQHWFPTAYGQFQPWHIDNLYLDVLIERGVLGALVLGGWAAWAALALWPCLRRGDPLAWGLAGSLGGLFSLGAVISVTELPRVMLILGILLWIGGRFRERFVNK